MALSTKRKLSAEEFWQLPERPDARLELVEGKVFEVPGSTMRHSALVALIFSVLRAHVLPTRLGQVFPDGLTYLLRRDPDTMRIPDVSFIPNERLPEGGPLESYSDVTPALVVQVVSPGNSAEELRRRVRDYVEAGVSQVWVVWPAEQTVSVYSGSMVPQELGPDDTLDGGDVLPGFSVTVADLFDIEW